MTKPSRGIFALAGALALSACTVFPIPEAPRLMELAPPAEREVFNTPRPAALRVDTPLASDPLDSTRVLVKPTPYEFQALPGARWRDSIPVVLRDYLIQEFRQSGSFTSVMTDTSPATAGLTLVTELTGFHAETRADGTTVVIHLHTELMENRSRKSLCVLDQREEALAASAKLDDLMSAFSLAASALSTDITRWSRDCLADA